MTRTDRIIDAITDPDSKPNKFARWVIAISVFCIVILVLFQYIGGTY